MTARLRQNSCYFNNLKENLQHHCRKCGILVCQSCSSRRLTLTTSKDSVRVCDSCHVVEMNAGRGILMTFESAGNHLTSNNKKDDLTKVRAAS